MLQKQNKECVLFTGSRSDMWKKMSEYAFVYSPIGNGFDCHRTWEALTLGCIVIAQDSPTIREFTGKFPIIIRDDVQNIKAKDLENWLQKYSSTPLGDLSIVKWAYKLHNNLVDTYTTTDALSKNYVLSPQFNKKEWDDIRKSQKIMTQMLKKFDQVCTKYNLKYWAIGGTLIGAVRHAGWIPWDGDIDVGMTEKDYNKLKKIIESELPEEYFFQTKENDKYYTSPINKIRYKYAWYSDGDPKRWHHGIQLDIFVLDNNGNIPGLPSDGDRPRIYKRKDIQSILFPVKRLPFEDTTVWVPNNYEKYLTLWLGSYPPKILSLKKCATHEGRISFDVPKLWKEKMYPHLY